LGPYITPGKVYGTSKSEGKKSWKICSFIDKKNPLTFLNDLKWPRATVKS